MAEPETENIQALPDDGRALTLSQQILYSIGMVTTDLTPTLIVAWLMYFYAPPTDSHLPSYLTILAVGFLNFFGRMVDAISNPVVGIWSDRTRSPRGRRIPFLLYLTPPMALGFVLIWFPVTSGVSVLNFVWLLVWISLFWFSYTAVVAPYLSMHPEITPYRQERINVSTWMGVFNFLGMILATVVMGEIIGRFKGGVYLAGFHFKDGYKVAGLVSAALILITFYVPAFTIKERAHTESKEVPFGFIRSIVLCFKNPSFPSYIIPIALMRMAGDMVIAMIPFLVKAVLWPKPGMPGIFHGKESEFVAGIMQGLIIIIAGLLFPLIAWLGGRFGKKRVVLCALIWFAVVTPFFATIRHWPFLPVHIRGMIILLLLAPAISPLIVLQRPMIADIMDYDEKLTGYRREATYNGVEGLCTKFGAGLALITVAGFLYLWGKEAASPGGILAIGPAAAVLGLIAAIIFSRYPIKK